MKNKKYGRVGSGVIKSSKKIFDIIPTGEFTGDKLRELIQSSMPLTYEQIALRLGYLIHIGLLYKNGRSIYVKSLNKSTIIDNSFMPTVKKISDFSTSDLIQELKLRNTDLLKYEIIKIERTII